MANLTAFDEVLGEGHYGIVYGGTYGPHPVAIKAFKLPLLTAQQIFSALTEIKLMGYIGDHTNIVKFHGVDISRLQSGNRVSITGAQKHKICGNTNSVLQDKCTW